jgi:hypothetical protein
MIESKSFFGRLAKAAAKMLRPGKMKMCAPP